MLTIQNAATAADQLSRTDCCGECRSAATKHRLIVAYQSAVALRQLQGSDLSISEAGQWFLTQALNDPQCGKLLETGYRKLRNGLLHLGLSDIGVAPGSALTLDVVLCSYTGEDSATDVVDTINGALTTIARTMEAWCQRPRTAASVFARYCTGPPRDGGVLGRRCGCPVGGHGASRSALVHRPRRIEQPQPSKEAP